MRAPLEWAPSYGTQLLNERSFEKIWFLFTINNRNFRKKLLNISKVSIKSLEWRQWDCSGVFIFNFERIWLVLSSVPIFDFK